VRGRRDVALAFPFLLHGEIGRRIEVIVGVDQGLGALGVNRGYRQRRSQTCGAKTYSAKAGQKLAAGRACRIASRTMVEQHGVSSRFFADFWPIFVFLESMIAAPLRRRNGLTAAEPLGL